MEKKNPNPTVSIVVNAHNEGIVLHRTLKSLDQNVAFAKKKGIDTEVIIVADKVDEPTKDYLEDRSATALTLVKPRIEYVEYGDLGLSRNHGIRLAKGDYVGNFDGDDLWSKNWIAGAVATLQKNKGVVVHHAAVLNFGTKNGVWHIHSSTEPTFNPRSVVEDNWWPSCMMTHRNVALEFPYAATLRTRHFSNEDWHWNAETLAGGVEHIKVPETTLFYRRKETSMGLAHSTGLVTPNKLFTPSGLATYEKRRVVTKLETAAKKQAEFVVPVTRWTKSKTRKIAIKTVRVSGKVAVRMGKRYGKKFLDSHHRVERFARSVHGATKELLAPPAVVDGVPLAGPRVPAWLKEQWYEANSIEPHLFPSRHRLSTLYNRRMMTMGKEQSAYWQLANQIGENVEYLMIVPYVRRAGAYIVGMYYVKAFKELHPDAEVVVLATESTYSSEPEMIPAGVRFVEAPAPFCNASKGLQEKILGKLFINIKPTRIHVLHSQEGFRALARYAPQISYRSKLYLSTFNYDYTSDGQRMNAFLAFGEPILPFVTKVFTDNEWVVDDTIDIFGVPKVLLSAHDMPVTLPEKVPQGENLRAIDGKMRILWAARLAKQKRPDILYEIAAAAHKAHLPYEFVVYGEIYDKIITQNLLDKLCALPNVLYKGAFHKGILALPVAGFEVYLSTSEAEGTPNAILEAQAGGLLVVAPEIGGIPEAISDRTSGMLVHDFQNVQGYLEAFDYIYKHPDQAKKMVQKGQKDIQTHRSWQAFVEQLQKDLL